MRKTKVGDYVYLYIVSNDMKGVVHIKDEYNGTDNNAEWVVKIGNGWKAGTKCPVPCKYPTGAVLHNPAVLFYPPQVKDVREAGYQITDIRKPTKGELIVPYLNLPERRIPSFSKPLQVAHDFTVTESAGGIRYIVSQVTSNSDSDFSLLTIALN